jgi:hypothetical protein
MPASAERALADAGIKKKKASPCGLLLVFWVRPLPQGSPDPREGYPVYAACF